MRLKRRHDRRCDRVREWVSLEVDGELSRFEQALAEAHLRECSDCAAFRHDVHALTDAVRATPLERLERPVVVARPRRPLFPSLPATRPLQVAAAAMAVAAVGLGSLTSSLGRQPDHAARLGVGLRSPVDAAPNALVERQRVESEQRVLALQAEVSQSVEGGRQLT